MDGKALVEALKEGGRIALFAGLAALSAWVANQLTGADPSSAQVIVGTILLRLLDKFIHENEDLDAGGIAPF